MREKRRLTLEELRDMPVEMWRLEVAQLEYEISTSACYGLEQEAMALLDDPEITPEKVVELREKLQRAIGAIVEEECAKCGCAFSASFEGTVCPDCVEIAAAV